MIPLIGGLIGTFILIETSSGWVFEQKLDLFSVVFGVLLTVVLFYPVRKLVFTKDIGD